MQLSLPVFINSRKGIDSPTTTSYLYFSKVKIGWINSLLLNSNFFLRLSQFLTNNDSLLPYAAAAALLLCRGDVIFGTELGLKPFLSLLLLVSWIASYLCSASSSFKFITFKPSLIKNSSILSSKVPAWEKLDFVENLSFYYFKGLFVGAISEFRYSSLIGCWLFRVFKKVEMKSSLWCTIVALLYLTFSLSTLIRKLEFILSKGYSSIY